MKEQKLKLLDKSGDKEFFTIIPNYILNHSSVYDRALYIQMKRMAGDDGSCWASKKELAKLCKMSVGQTTKSLKYLLERGWIKFEGKKKGRTKPSYEYSIVNIWHINSDFYRQKESSYSEQSKKKVHTVNLESSPGDTKEYPISEEESLLRNNGEDKTSSKYLIYKNLIGYLKEKRGLERLDGTVVQNNRYILHLLKHRAGGDVELIKKAIDQSNYKSFQKIYYNWNSIMSERTIKI